MNWLPRCFSWRPIWRTSLLLAVVALLGVSAGCSRQKTVDAVKAEDSKPDEWPKITKFAGFANLLEGFRQAAGSSPTAAVAAFGSEKISERFKSLSQLAPDEESKGSDADRVKEADRVWSGFFRSAIYQPVFYSDDTRLGIFLNPWSDTVLVTLWKVAAAGDPVIEDVELLAGDSFRNPGEQKIEVAPLWTRSKASPFLSVYDSAYNLLSLTAERFGGEKVSSGRGWRDIFPGLRDAAVVKTHRQIAWFRCLHHAFALASFWAEGEHRPLREKMGSMFEQINHGDLKAVLTDASHTLPETRAILLAAHPDTWTAQEIVAIGESAHQQMVFSSDPSFPGYFLTFVFEKKKDRPVLRRVDFMPYRLYADRRNALRRVSGPAGEERQ